MAVAVPKQKLVLAQPTHSARTLAQLLKSSLDEEQHREQASFLPFAASTSSQDKDFVARTVYVSGWDADVPDDELCAFFSQRCGPITAANLPPRVRYGKQGVPLVTRNTIQAPHRSDIGVGG